MPSTCAFCRMSADPARALGGLLYEDELIWAAHDLEDGPTTFRGAVVLVVKRHTDDGLAGLTDEEGARIGRLTASASRALRTVLGVPWTYAYCFTEAIHHVHQFVVARYPEVPRDHIRLELRRWPAAPRSDEAGIRALAEELRTAMTSGPAAPARSPGPAPERRRTERASPRRP
jgi:histidine triad (HIT) family protein